MHTSISVLLILGSRWQQFLESKWYKGGCIYFFVPLCTQKYSFESTYFKIFQDFTELDVI